MRVPFTKMHGAGNDFVVLDERTTPLDLTQAQIVALADRHRGIGCDQLVTIGAAPDGAVRLRFFNPDGGEAGACGNGTRCAAHLLMTETGATTLDLHTAAGILPAIRLPDGQVKVDMGEPVLRWSEVPLSCNIDTLHLDLPGDPAALSMGNPHVTFFDTPLDDAPRLGPVIEHDPLFPERANVGFVQVLDAHRLRLRVWERGAGLTLACGSGACAALVNAHRRGLAARSADIVMDGGTLHVTWRDDGHVELAGPAIISYRGEIDLATAHQHDPA